MTRAYECEHGRVTRKCERCDDAEELARLRSIEAAARVVSEAGLTWAFSGDKAAPQTLFDALCALSSLLDSDQDGPA